jgi:3',5'-cyclic AMP phosphodiesterase CpdA
MAVNPRVSTTIRIPGLAKPSRILHISDIHVCRPDPEGPYAEAGRKRYNSIKHRDNAEVERRALRLFDNITAKDFDAVILTGDLVDVLSKSAVDFIHQLLDKCPARLHLVAGNHDSCFPLAKSSAKERPANLEYWSAFGDRRPKLFDRWEIQGLQFLAVDDVHYQIDAEQLAFVRKHLAAGQPTIFVTHIPLSTPRLKELTTLKWKDPILLGETVDDSVRTRWNWDPPVPETGELIDLLKKSTNLHAILAGHVHFGHEEPFSQTAVQLVAPPGFDEAFRIIDFEPQ